MSHRNGWPHLMRVATATGTVALLMLVLAAPAVAAPVQRVTIEIDESFEDAFLTEACGTRVVVSIRGTLKVTLIHNRAGQLVREIAPAGGGTNTFTAPDTGRSFSFPFNTMIVDYGSGAAIGSSFTLKIAGVIGNVPGYIDADAGQVVLAGFVKGFDEDGIPLLEFTEFVSARGNFNDGEAIVEAMCAALTGSR
jgi:hypothetical protein